MTRSTTAFEEEMLDALLGISHDEDDDRKDDDDKPEEDKQDEEKK